MSEHREKLQSENVEQTAQIFTLRIQVINQEGENLKWRGRIQHIQSGEVRYCRDWDSFAAYVEEILWYPPST